MKQMQSENLWNVQRNKNKGNSIDGAAAGAKEMETNVELHNGILARYYYCYYFYLLIGNNRN